MIERRWAADLFWQHQGDGRISVWLMDGVRVVAGTLLSPSLVLDTNWKIVGQRISMVTEAETSSGTTRVMAALRSG